MDSTAERTVSGRGLIIVGLVVIAAVTVAGVVLGPGLREQVRQEQRPRTLREPVAAGSYAGHPWEAIGHYDGTKNCVELRYRGVELGQACDTGPPVQSTRVGADGPVVAYGTAPETSSEMAVSLDNGELVRAPVKAGDLGFPVGLWAAEIPGDAAVVATEPAP
ncbi:MAG: hypothetical protein GEU74_09250 [Nitriliruptorales bacterium]|nr:hypothetical protein [Nitriliruptorales bacterium]